MQGGVHINFPCRLMIFYIFLNYLFIYFLYVFDLSINKAKIITTVLLKHKMNNIY